MTEIEYKSLKQGDAVSYGPFSKVFYDRTTTQRADGTSYSEPHVVMVDRKGDEKAVFERLFIKNAKNHPRSINARTSTRHSDLQYS